MRFLGRVAYSAPQLADRPATRVFCLAGNQTINVRQSCPLGRTDTLQLGQLYY